MLDELIVTNLGLIQEATVEPGPGLVVVTGETGTGKTLLLGALRLLTGGQARRDLVGPAGDEAMVQARFTTDGDELTVARRIASSGRSRSYLDGMASPLRTLEDRTRDIVEIIAQHDHLHLTRSAHVRSLLDGALDAGGRAAREAFRETWRRLRDLEMETEALGGDTRALERELATCAHQAQEISAAGFAPGDDEVLAASAQRLRNGRAILEGLQDAAGALGEDGLDRHVDVAVAALERVASLDPQLSDLATQAADLASLASELRAEVVRAADGDDDTDDSDQLAEVEERLATLGDLRRRYGDSLDEVLAFGVEAGERAGDLTELLARAATVDEERSAAHGEVAAAAAVLTGHREAAGRRLVDDAVAHLTELGFGDPVLEFALTPVSPGATGADRVELLFASDRGLEPGPVSRIASGGELSRLVLALRLAAGAGDATVAAFDEIDAGVGGTVALALGRKLAGLSRTCQVLCVTHLPQVAAHADTHLVVERTGSRTTVRPVVGEERLEELSRMLAGMPESERGRDHAAELLAQVGADR